MKNRSRKSRFIAKVTLFAAVATIASSLAAPGGVLALGRAQAVTAGLSQVAAPAQSPAPLSPHAGGRPIPAPRVARVFASAVQPTAFAASGLVAPEALLAAGLALSALLGGWLLEFVGRSSRTRGQPRVGELAL